MIKTIIQKFGGRPAVSSQDIPRYPPYSKGLPTVTVDELLATQCELITKISYTTRYDEAHFLQWYYPAIRRYAQFVHLLPASEAHHHRGVGGLLRHGLEASLEALSKITNGGAPLGLDVMGQERRRVIPVWELTCFLAGLMHDMGKAVTDMKVTDLKGLYTWDPHQEDLIAWASRNKVDRYFVRFKQGPRHKIHELSTTLVVNYILTDELKSFICNTAPGVMEKLLAAVTGTVMGRNIIHDYMFYADQRSVEHDLKVNRLEAGVSGEVGTPVERTLIDVMRRKVKEGAWQPNKPGSCLWMINHSLFVVWRPAAEDVTRAIAQSKAPGIPRDPDTLADILIERDLAQPCPVDGQNLRYWKIAPEVLQKTGEKQVELRALRLSSPELIIDPPPTSVPGMILLGAPSQASAPPIQQPAPALKKADSNQLPSAPVPPAPDKQILTPPEQPAPPPVEEPWNVSGVDEFVLKGPDKHQGEGFEAAAELILPVLGGEPSKKKLKKSGSPAERKAATATLVEAPPVVQIEALGEDAEKVTCANDFLDRSLAGSVLHAIASDLAMGKAQWGKEVITIENDLVAIRYPEGFGGQGCDPKDLLVAMDAENWVALDPHSPLRKVREIDGFKKNKGKGICKAVVLEKIVSQSFLVITRARQAPMPGIDPSPSDRKTSTRETTPAAEDHAPNTEPLFKKTLPSREEHIPVAPVPAGDSELNQAATELRSLIAPENSPFQTVQLGGKFYITYDNAFGWLMKNHGLSRTATTKILGSTEFVTFVEKGEKLIGPS